jgi:hypothetical protein
MNDFRDPLINFAMDRGIQPRAILYVKLTPVDIEYAYIEDDKTICVKKEPVQWDF